MAVLPVDQAVPGLAVTNVAILILFLRAQLEAEPDRSRIGHGAVSIDGYSDNPLRLDDRTIIRADTLSVRGG